MFFRRATAGDIETLTALRKKQLIDEGISPTDIDRELADFFRRKLSDGSLVEWVCTEHDTIVATGAIIFYDFPPSYINKSGVKGYITNMYTAPAYRGQGIATMMLQKLTEEAKLRQVENLWLGASKMGRPVYLAYGFQEADSFLELNISDNGMADIDSIS